MVTKHQPRYIYRFTGRKAAERPLAQTQGCTPGTSAVLWISERPHTVCRMLDKCETIIHGAYQKRKNLLCMHFVKTVVLRFNLHVEHFNKLMHLSTSPWSCASLTDVGALLALLCRSSSDFLLASAASSLDTSDLYLSVSLTCSVHFEPILGKEVRNRVGMVVEDLTSSAFR